MSQQSMFLFCSVEQLKREKRITRYVEELRDEVSAFYVNGEISVISTVCPHFGGDFTFDEKTCHLTCTWHGWKFHLKTGKSLTSLQEYEKGSFVRTVLGNGKSQSIGCFPYRGQLVRYDFKINEDQLEVVIP